VKSVERLFVAQHARGAFPGGQLVVQRGGVRLLDLALGTARGFREHEAPPISVTPETRFQVMSASKAVLARAIARLEARGLLDVHAAVRRYIPEFCAPEVTVLDVLTHRSGCTMPVLSSQPELWHDWANVVAALRTEPPSYPRGTLAYQPIAFGWILAEVLQRITGLSLQVFSAREFGSDLCWTATEAAAHTYWLGAKRYLLNGENLAARFEHTNNTVSSRTALVPGAGLLASARSLAAFYDSLLQDKSESFQRYTSVATRGFDKISGAYVTLGRGFGLGWRWPHPYGWWGSQGCFGHPGGFSVVAYADPTARAGIAIVTNGNRSLSDLVRRFAPLSSAIRRELRGGLARIKDC
jgi:CubicO group peptidase (beta-lactamase class C family)